MQTFLDSVRRSRELPIRASMELGIGDHKEAQKAQKPVVFAPLVLSCGHRFCRFQRSSLSGMHSSLLHLRETESAERGKQTCDDRCQRAFHDQRCRKGAAILERLKVRRADDVESGAAEQFRKLA